MLSVGGYVLVNHCMYNVEGGHRAVIYNRYAPVVRVLGQQSRMCLRATHERAAESHVLRIFVLSVSLLSAFSASLSCFLTLHGIAVLTR